MDKTNVTLLQSPLSRHSRLIDERLTQRETGFSAKKPTIATLQRRTGVNGGQWKYKSRFFGVTSGLGQDCPKNQGYCNW